MDVNFEPAGQSGRRIRMGRPFLSVRSRLLPTAWHRQKCLCHPCTIAPMSRPATGQPTERHERPHRWQQRMIRRDDDEGSRSGGGVIQPHDEGVGGSGGGDASRPHDEGVGGSGGGVSRPQGGGGGVSKGGGVVSSGPAGWVVPLRGGSDARFSLPCGFKPAPSPFDQCALWRRPSFGNACHHGAKSLQWGQCSSIAACSFIFEDACVCHPQSVCSIVVCRDRVHRAGRRQAVESGGQRRRRTGDRRQSVREHGLGESGRHRRHRGESDALLSLARDCRSFARRQPTS